MNMKLFKLAVFLIAISLMMGACSQKPAESPADVVQKIYGASNPFRNETLDSALFSKNLYQLIT